MFTANIDLVRCHGYPWSVVMPFDNQGCRRTIRAVGKSSQLVVFSRARFALQFLELSKPVIAGLKSRYEPSGKATVASWSWRGRSEPVRGGPTTRAPTAVIAKQCRRAHAQPPAAETARIDVLPRLRDHCPCGVGWHLRRVPMGVRLIC